MNQPVVSTDHAIYSEEAGCFISSKFQRLAEILQDYDPDLEMRWIPPSARSSEDSRPYCIVHSPTGLKPYVVMYFTEQDNPELILAKIFEGDGKHSSIERKIVAQENAHKAFVQKEWLERQEEMADKFHYLLQRAPNYIKWVNSKGDKVKLDEERRQRPR